MWCLFVSVSIHTLRIDVLIVTKILFKYNRRAQDWTRGKSRKSCIIFFKSPTRSKHTSFACRYFVLCACSFIAALFASSLRASWTTSTILSMHRPSHILTRITCIVTFTNPSCVLQLLMDVALLLPGGINKEEAEPRRSHGKTRTLSFYRAISNAFLFFFRPNTIQKSFLAFCFFAITADQPDCQTTGSTNISFPISTTKQSTYNTFTPHPIHNNRIVLLAEPVVTIVQRTAFLLFIA